MARYEHLPLYRKAFGLLVYLETAVAGFSKMNIIANPGVEKTDFEIWCVAVSAINGCGACLDSHEAELKKRGVPNTAIQAALRIGAVINAVSRVSAAEAALAAA